MGHVVHHAIIATTFDQNKAQEFATFCASRGLSHCVVESGVNCYFTIFIGPDGSKSGWPESDEGDMLRKEAKERLASYAYEDGSNPFEWAEISYSSDDCAAKIVSHAWQKKTTKKEKK
jgi:hypothetical protein